MLGRNAEGMFRLESPSVTILEFADNGKPSVVDVSLTLRRASDAEVNVGLIKRVKGRGKGFAKKKG
jgi:phage protein U